MLPKLLILNNNNIVVTIKLLRCCPVGLNFFQGLRFPQWRKVPKHQTRALNSGSKKSQGSRKLHKGGCDRNYSECIYLKHIRKKM